VPLLKKGAVLGSDVSGECYQVTSGRIAEGGFGEVYRGALLDGRRDPVHDVAIKVLTNPLSWHGEAYFGRLLEDHDRVVRLLDAFQIASGGGAARLTKYLLVFEWMEDGTVWDFLGAGNGPVPESGVVHQTGQILELLQLLHRRGICHGDITPRNVFIRNGELVLGDLGIAKQSLEDGPISLGASTPAVFAPPDSGGWSWTPSDDVYQLALIALSALAGEVVVTYEVCGRLLKSLEASDATKGWIRDALAARGERFVDAGEALAALREEPIKPAPPPRSLRGQHVVFTGKLSTTRAVAQQKAKGAGALVQSRVNGATSLIVAGQPNPLQIGQEHGTKLYDAHRRIRRGQRISIIDEQRFERLVGK
jgi:serine/threonine protein kinase